MKIALFVALGGALGAVCRWALSSGIDRLATARGLWIHLPVTTLGTLAANVLGSLVMGGFFAYSVARGVAAEPLRWFLAVGFLGSFTTFSTFSLHTHELFRQGHPGHALGNVALNVVLTLLAVAIGFAITQKALSTGG